MLIFFFTKDTKILSFFLKHYTIKKAIKYYLLINSTKIQK